MSKDERAAVPIPPSPRAATARSAQGDTLTRRIVRRFTEPSALRAAQRRAQAGELALDLETEELGRAERGAMLVSGDFSFGGQPVSAESARALWALDGPSPAWRAEAHGFEWLADLAAFGGERASETAAQHLDAWIRERADTYDALIWREDVAARRLRAVVLHARMALPLERDRRDRALRVVSAHGEWLLKRVDGLEPGMARLRAGVALAELSLSAAGWEGRRDTLAALLDDALASGVLADGCPLSRNPEDALTLLMQTRLLSQRYAERGVEPPPLLDAAVEALAMAARFFRTADGGLPLLHGALERADGRLESELARRRLPHVAPQSLSEARYERMSGGRVAVIVDLGETPGGPDAETGCASALSFELTAGRRRVIVNGGSGAHLDEDWALAARAEGAHSTLTFDDAAFTTLTEPVGPPEAHRPPRLAGPPGAAGERKQERNGLWVLGSHDGYLAEYGVRLSRRLFLSSDGGDFRGEDSAAVDTADMRLFQRRLGRMRRRDRQRGFAFTARFHLHPDVAASMVADGDAVTLRLPSGEIWVMRQAGGVLDLRPSVYFGAGDAPEKTKQIVVTAAARDAMTQLRWAFRRVGDLSALPKDVEALEARDDLALAARRKSAVELG
ncbi:MAG: heparinase II/III family protein [Pseudomonadota bacterium]